MDEAINSRTIHLTGYNNMLQRNMNIKAVLRDLDRTIEHLRQVSIEEPSGIPICKIVSKKQLWEEAKAKEKERKKKDVEDLAKQIELSWGIDQNDLGHRLKRLQEFLREGRRVEILVAPKKRGRRATTEEMEALLENVKKAANEVKGTEEWKDMDGGVGIHTTLHFQCYSNMSTGTNDVQSEELAAMARPAMEEKQARKEREKQERRDKEDKRLQRKKEEEESKERAKRLVL